MRLISGIRHAARNFENKNDPHKDVPCGMRLFDYDHSKFELNHRAPANAGIEA
jgi:hypothetical protein